MQRNFSVTSKRGLLMVTVRVLCLHSTRLLLSSFLEHAYWCITRSCNNLSDMAVKKSWHRLPLEKNKIRFPNGWQRSSEPTSRLMSTQGYVVIISKPNVSKKYRIYSYLLKNKIHSGEGFFLWTRNNRENLQKREHWSSENERTLRGKTMHVVEKKQDDHIKSWHQTWHWGAWSGTFEAKGKRIGLSPGKWIY